jgi:hypothetical protein
MTDRTPDRRKRAASTSVPANVAAWFAGEAAAPVFTVCGYPGNVLARAWWQAWVAAHPNAPPPERFEWIASPPPACLHGSPYETAVAQARASYQRGVKLGIYNRKGNT